MKSPPNHSHPPRRCRSPILHWRQRGLCLSATLLRYDDLPFGGPPGGQPDVDSFDPRSRRFSVGHLAGFDMAIHRHQWACDHGPNIVIAQPTDIPVHHDRPDERTGREGSGGPRTRRYRQRDLISACSGVASPPPPFWSVCIRPGRARDGTEAIDHATPNRVVLLHPGLSRHHHLDHPYFLSWKHQPSTRGANAN